MKTRLTNNWELKILSVVLAIVLWLIVVNVSDPEKTTTITNIPITITNEDAVTGQEKVYEVISGKTATVKVTGPRTIVDSLEASSFEATADLSKLSMTNAVEVEVELVKASYRSKVDIDVETTMRIEVEDLITQEFTIQENTSGSVKDGYVIYDTSLKDANVSVTAPESVMATIAKVAVSVNVQGANRDFTVTSAIQAYDSRGNVIDAKSKKISFGLATTEVALTVYPVKQVPIKYQIDETAYPNAVISATNISREYIMVAGRKEALDSINEINLDTTSLVIAEEQSQYELTYSYDDLLPEGVYVYGEDTSVTLKVTTDAIITKTFTVPVSEIAIKSLGDGFSASHETTGNITYIIRGRKSLLDAFVPEDNPLFVSTKDLGEGVYDLEVQMDLDETIELITPLRITVRVMSKDRPTDPTSDETSSEQGSSDSNTSGGNENTTGENVTTPASGEVTPDPESGSDTSEGTEPANEGV